MEFGKLDSVDDVNWELPETDSLSVEFLKQSRLKCLTDKKISSESFDLYFGAPAWAHKEWVGKIYPVGAKSSEYLSYYSKYFSCLEMNTTHYHIPRPEQVEKWISQVAGRFVFCPKIVKDISHAPNGLLHNGLRMEWITFLKQLGSYCGPSFLQLPPHFSYEKKAELFHFLKMWPDDFELALEFRHPSWFQEGRIHEKLVQYLQSRNIGLVITDVAGRRDVLHSSLSADFAQLRFIGNDLHASDFSRAEQWVRRVKQWEELGLKKIYFFIHEPDDLKVPEMSEFFVKLFSEVGGWPVESRLITDQQLGLRL